MYGNGLVEATQINADLEIPAVLEVMNMIFQYSSVQNSALLDGPKILQFRIIAHLWLYCRLMTAKRKGNNSQ